MTSRNHRPGGTLTDRIAASAALVLAVIALVGSGVSCRRAKVGEDAAAPPALARFKLIEGAVSVRARGEFDWKAATADHLLNRDDLVRTGPNGKAQITFLDNAVIHLGSNSLVVITEAAATPRPRSSVRPPARRSRA